MNAPNYSLSISARSYAATLAALATVLVVIHLSLYIYNYQVEELPWLLLQLFDLDEENNLPTWFSSFALLNNALILLLISKGPTHSTEIKFQNHWRFLAIGFLILAIDEVAGLHESFNTSIKINWAIPGAILVLFIAAAFVPFLLSLRRNLAILYVISGTLFVSGAIVTELLSENMDSDTLAYTLAVAVEEGLELAGSLMFLAVNLREMQRGSGNDANQVNLSVSFSE